MSVITNIKKKNMTTHELLKILDSTFPDVEFDIFKESVPTLLSIADLKKNLMIVNYNKHTLCFENDRFGGVQRPPARRKATSYIFKKGLTLKSFWLGTLYGFGSVALQIVLGVGAALLLSESFKGRSLVRGIALFPYVVPTIVVVLIWRWTLNDSYGLLNYILETVGLISGPVAWLGPSVILISLILVSTWTFFPFVLITVLARLQTINPELYDAASVDGASAWKRFYHVTLPQLRTILFVVIMLRFIFMFTKFDIVWLLGGGTGGTGRFIRTLPVYTYIKTFGQLQVGAGAAMAVIMVLILVAVAVPYFKLFRPSRDL